VYFYTLREFLEPLLPPETQEELQAMPLGVPYLPALVAPKEGSERYR
jgi:hypothetical protein